MQKIGWMLAGLTAMLPFASCVLSAQNSDNEIAPPAAPQDEKTLALQGLYGNDFTAKLAISSLVSIGEPAIPELQALTKDPDPKVAARARDALGQITGQWGGGEGIVWKRSVAAAQNKGKPIMVLHLFGKFDEEFC